jgi:multiple sugar transport system permease protein
MCLLTIYPVLRVISLSFYKYNFISDLKPSFVGLANYARTLNDGLFIQSGINTLVFCFVATFLEVGLGLILALIFQQNFPFKKSFMTFAIFPMMLSTMVICAVWRIMYHYDIGLFNYILSILHLSKVGWLVNPNRALLSVVFVDVWQWTPFCFLLSQAAMSSISTNIFEAAKIDGAPYWTLVTKVTLPIIKSQIFLLVMLRTIDTFKIYSKIYALTLGGPGNATETLSYYIYRQGFSYFNMGIASAASILTLAIVTLISIIYIKNVMVGDEA